MAVPGCEVEGVKEVLDCVLEGVKTIGGTTGCVTWLVPRECQKMSK